jgi:hypothetical protein
MAAHSGPRPEYGAADGKSISRLAERIQGQQLAGGEYPSPPDCPEFGGRLTKSHDFSYVTGSAQSGHCTRDSVLFVGRRIHVRLGRFGGRLFGRGR